MCVYKKDIEDLLNNLLPFPLHLQPPHQKPTKINL